MIFNQYPDIWTRIPSADIVFPKQREDPIDSTIITDVCNLFLKHDLQKTLSVVLNHRHFDLHEGEKLVERGQISTPWLIDEETLGEAKERIIARTWTFFEGNLVPYEYKFCEDEDEKAFQPSPEFVSELHTLLTDRDMIEHLGIQLLDDDLGRGQYEITLGRVSMMLKGDGPGHQVTVGWRSDGGSGSKPTPTQYCNVPGACGCNRCC